MPDWAVWCNQHALTNTGRQRMISHASARNEETAVLLTTITAVSFRPAALCSCFTVLGPADWSQRLQRKSDECVMYVRILPPVKCFTASSNFNRNLLSNRVRWLLCVATVGNILSLLTEASIVLLTTLFRCMSSR